MHTYTASSVYNHSLTGNNSYCNDRLRKCKTTRTHFLKYGAVVSNLTNFFALPGIRTHSPNTGSIGVLVLVVYF